MNSKKGFTLVELLGVIVILGLLAALIFPTMNGVIRNARIKSNNSQKQLIENAAELWASENNIELSNDIGSEFKISIDDLKKAGYLKKADIRDLEKDVNLTNACVIIKTQFNNYTYTFYETCE